MTETTQTNIDLENPAYYNNREISWLAFNERVLEEALDETNPLLERLRFLGIFSSNLDEFFMVRVAGLKDQVKAGFNKPENKAGLTPKQQLSAITKKNSELVRLQDHFFTETAVPLLASENIRFLSTLELNSDQYKYVQEYFMSNIMPVLTPMAVDAYRPFPMLLNKSLNLAVRLQKDAGDEKESIAIVQVPGVLPRFLVLPSSDGSREYILLEQVLAEFIHMLFKGFTVVSASPFRITRNADLTIHEEGARDLLREIEKELKKRKWGAAVRLECQHGMMDDYILEFLLEALEVHPDDVYTLKGPIDLTFLFPLCDELAPEWEHLVYETLIPQPPEDLIAESDVFDAADDRDILLHHPYESFQPVIDFISTAADDPDVLAIKQTLYRVSGDSPIIAALARAAEQGKQVTVLVELKARFDEENNIQWAKTLEKSGVHVIYGITSLKTHSKIVLVVKKTAGGIKRYVHLGTGNYNDSTAKVYTDMGMITTRPSFGEDATNFFNHLSGFSQQPSWNEISTSPDGIRDELLHLIQQEIDCHKRNGSGHIIAKMNSLTDKELIIKLYEASQAGVRIELIVRGICCLKPGIPGVSESITVRSIVGRFLEHTRIFYFANSGRDDYYLSSADWMTRNMEKRIEIMFPVYEPILKKRLHAILQLILQDNVKAREQDSSGYYHYVEPAAGEPAVNSQLVLFEWASRFLDMNNE